MLIKRAGCVRCWVSLCYPGATQGQGQCCPAGRVAALWVVGKWEGADLKHGSGSRKWLLERCDIIEPAGCRAGLLSWDNLKTGFSEVGSFNGLQGMCPRDPNLPTLRRKIRS